MGPKLRYPTACVTQASTLVTAHVSFALAQNFAVSTEPEVCASTGAGVEAPFVAKLDAEQQNSYLYAGWNGWTADAISLVRALTSAFFVHKRVVMFCGLTNPKMISCCSG